MDFVKCSHCRGTGKREISGVYADTLAMLRMLTHSATGADLAKAEGCKPPAMNNRLAALERLGLATSIRYGRKRLYRAIRHKNPKAHA